MLLVSAHLLYCVGKGEGGRERERERERTQAETIEHSSSSSSDPVRCPDETCCTRNGKKGGRWLMAYSRVGGIVKQNGLEVLLAAMERNVDLHRSRQRMPMCILSAVWPTEQGGRREAGEGEGGGSP